MAAGAYIIFYADSDPKEGERHLTFSLSKAGEEVALFDSVGGANNLIDHVEFGAQQTDVAYVWCGENDWRPGAGTLGATNICLNAAAYLPLVVR